MEEYTKLKALLDKIEDIAKKYEAKYYSLLLKEAQREAEEARKEADRTRQEALKVKEEATRERARMERVQRLQSLEGRRKPRIHIAETEWGTFFDILQSPS